MYLKIASPLLMQEQVHTQASSFRLAPPDLVRRGHATERLVAYAQPGGLLGTELTLQLQHRLPSSPSPQCRPDLRAGTGCYAGWPAPCPCVSA